MASPSCVVDSFEDSSGADQNGSRTLEFCLVNTDDGGQITFDTSSSRTIVLSSVLFRAGDITIDGVGLITLAAAQDVETRLLDVNGDLTLYGMKFEGGTAEGDGGAVHTSGNAIVSNSTFRNNRALEVISPGTNAEQESDGGALYAELNIEIFGSTFVGNSAAWDGGAVHSQAGAINVESSVFESNHASHDGGGISLDDTSLTLTIRSSEFYLNTATRHGGAVFGDDDVDIFDSVFEENSAGADGGAVYSDYVADISGSLFNLNSADNKGGALYVHEDVIIGLSSFVRNEAVQDGGAFYLEDEDAFIRRSYFGYNSAGNDGGVAYIEEDLDVTNSTFYKNHADNRGGVFIQDNSNDDGFLVYSTFASNSAGEAPVMYFQGDDMELFGSVFMDHVGPAFIYANTRTGFIDWGANVTSGAEAEFDHESSRTGASSSSVGLIAPGEPTISFRPEIKFSSPESMGTSVTGELADAARYSLNLPDVDQSGSERSSLTFLASPGSMEVDIAPAGSFGGHDVQVREPDISLGLSEVNAANTTDSFDTWGGVFVSEDNWTSSLELFSRVSQCDYSMNSTLVDPGLYNEYQYTGPSGLEIQNLRISCETDPVTIGSGTVIFESVREFEGSFFSQKLSAVISSGTPGDFRVSIGGNLGSDGDEVLVESGTSGDWDYAVTGGDSSDPILGYRSEYSFDFDETPGSAYSNGAGNSFLTKTDPVTAQAEITEVFEAQVWFVDYTTSEEATATTFASDFANAEFGCAIASVVDSTPDGSCQTQGPASAIPAKILPVDHSEQVLSFQSFFPGATLTKGVGGFIAAPSPYAGPTVTDARVQNQELSISGTNLNLISSLILGDDVLDLEENEGAFFVSISSVPAGTYQLQFVHGGGSVDTSFEVTIIEPEDDSGSAFWTTQISDTEIKFYAKNIVGAGKVQFFHNGNEVAWVNAQDATDPKLRVITSGPMTGANYLVRTRALVSGKNVFEVYVDGERVLRRAQGN